MQVLTRTNKTKTGKEFGRSLTIQTIEDGIKQFLILNNNNNNNEVDEFVNIETLKLIIKNINNVKSVLNDIEGNKIVIIKIGRFYSCSLLIIYDSNNVKVTVKLIDFPYSKIKEGIGKGDF